MGYVEVHEAHVEVHRTLGTHCNPRKASHGKVQRLSKQQYIRLVPLDLLSVADLIPESAFELGVFAELRSFFDCLFERFLEAAAISRFQRR